jgi:putative FmdB family regulatory protein
MPTYEFACPHGHEFEKFYKMSEAPASAPCPQCGEPATRRISGGAGLVFKGSGFYLTDYGKNAHRTSGDAKKGGDGESKGAESKGGEAKGGEAKGDAKGGESKAAGTPAKPDAPKAGESKPASKPSAPKKGE